MTRVLITGASSGIGKQIAYEFGKHSNDLLLVARNKEALKEIVQDLKRLYNIKVDYFVCDLSVDYSLLYEYCVKKKMNIDVLINNAGFGDYREFVDCDIDKQNNMLDLNNKALMNLCYLFGKQMKKQNKGHIINTASVASFVPGPYMATYYASKAFVLSFSLALRQELASYNVKVSCVCPGPTNSPFWKRANASTSDSYNSFFSRTCKQAAKTCYKVYIKNKAYLIDGLFYRICFSFLRILPLNLSAKILALVQNKTKKINN